MRIRARFSFPTFDASKYTKTLEEKCEVVLRQAARAWLRAVIPRVPVWAGTARGSLTQLGRAIQVAVPIEPRVVRKGLGPEVGASQSSYSFRKEGQRFIFSFQTTVPHYEFNDANKSPFPLKNPTPWQSFEAGEIAFNEYLQRNLTRQLPKIQDFVKVKTKIVR